MDPLKPWRSDPVETEDPALTSAPAAPLTPSWRQDPVVAETPAPEAEKKPGLLTRIKKAYTGEDTTDPEYAAQPEFGDAFRAAAGDKDPAGMDRIRNAIGLAQVAPTETGQLNILKSRIPGLEVKKDKFGATVLRAPGMVEFAYLNKPGFSAQDVGEFGMQTVATLPFTAGAGAGANIAARVGTGIAGLAAGSVAQDALAAGAGSGEGIDPLRAGIAGAIGGALPGVVEPVVKGLGMAAAYPINKARAVISPSGAAERKVTEAAVADRALGRGSRAPITEPEITAAQARGQDVRAMDVGGGENTRALARAAANTDPTARSMLEEVIDERFKTQAPRTAEFLNNLAARPGKTGVNAFATREEKAIAGRAARDPLYKKAYTDGATGLMSPVLSRIATAPAVQRGMQAANGALKNRAAAGTTTGARGPNGFTLEYWDQVKRHLDDRISTLKRQGAKSAAMDLDELRRPLVAELDRMVPSYAGARGTAQTFFKANDALEAGEKFVTGNWDVRAARAALGKMSAEERDLFGEGFADKFINTVRKTSDSRNILNAINASPAARERFTVALGPNRARALESFLRIEGIMDLGRKSMGNSTTARQLVELGLMGYGAYNSDTDGEALLYGALLFGHRKAGHWADARVAREVTKLLLSPKPTEFLRGLKQISSTPMMDNLREFDKFLLKSGVGREAAGGIAEKVGAPTTSAPPAQGQLPAPATIPPANQLPAPPPSNVPSATTVPKQRAQATPMDEARRMADAAIAQGAPREAVEKRLAAYLQANGMGTA